MKPKKIQLKELPFNGDFAVFEKWIVKLSYYQLDSKKPTIEIFENTIDVIENDLQIYGNTDKSICINFDNENQSKTILLDQESYIIKFLYIKEIDLQFNEKSEKIPQYFFEIRILKPLL